MCLLNIGNGRVARNSEDFEQVGRVDDEGHRRREHDRRRYAEFGGSAGRRRSSEPSHAESKLSYVT